MAWPTGQTNSHVGHEGDGAGAPYSVHHVHHHHGHLGGQGLRDDVSTSWPREHLKWIVFSTIFLLVLNHLNLSGGVDDNELILLGPHQLQHLVKLRGEQVEAGDDAAVRAQLVLFHYYRKK